MRNELVTVRNRETGKVGIIPRRIAENPITGAHLEIVPTGSKSKVPLGGGRLTVPTQEEAPLPKPTPQTKDKKEEDK